MGRSMCLIPVVADTGFNFEWNLEARHTGHESAEGFTDRIHFGFRHLEHQFVMHLHDELRMEPRLRSWRV